MATSHDERIQRLQQQLEQAKAAKRRADARLRATASKQARAEDTRRKVLLGSLLQQMMQDNQQTHEQVMTRLDKHLTRDADRRLFGMAPN